MANEVGIITQADRNVYFIVLDDQARARDVVAGAWDAVLDADWGDYDTAATEAGTSTGIYFGTFPAGISAGIYTIIPYQRIGATPAVTDTKLDGKRAYWTGTVLLDASALNAEGLAADAVTEIAAGVSSGSGTDIAQDVWEYTSRTLTQGPVVTYPGQAHSARELVKGKAYLNANGRAWTFTMPQGADWPTDLTGGTVTLTCAPTASFLLDNPAAVGFTTTGSVVTATGASRSVRVDLTAANTALMTVGHAAYDFEVEWKTSATDKAALVLGTITVLANEV